MFYLFFHSTCPWVNRTTSVSSWHNKYTSTSVNDDSIFEGNSVYFCTPAVWLKNKSAQWILCLVGSLLKWIKSLELVQIHWICNSGKPWMLPVSVHPYCTCECTYYLINTKHQIKESLSKSHNLKRKCFNKHCNILQAYKIAMACVLLQKYFLKDKDQFWGRKNPGSELLQITVTGCDNLEHFVFCTLHF